MALTSLPFVPGACSLLQESTVNDKKLARAAPALPLLITGWAPAFASSFLEVLRNERSRVSLYFVSHDAQLGQITYSCP